MSVAEASRTSGETPAETAAYWTYRGAQWLATSVPASIGRWVFRAAGRLAFLLMAAPRRTVQANLARILGRDADDRLVRRTAAEAFDLYARYWFDSFRLAASSPAALDARTDATGLENLDRALAAGRGCVVALGHLGNWDAAGAWVARRGYRIVSVNEHLRPERLFDLFRRHREEFGVGIFALGEPNLAGRLAGFLRDNGVVALIADRDIGGRGVEVEMFGAMRRIPSGPASLAISSGAPLLFCSVATTDRGWRLHIGPPLEVERTGELKADVRALTRRLAAEFERAIAAHPADWHVLQPGWPDA